MAAALPQLLRSETIDETNNDVLSSWKCKSIGFGDGCVVGRFEHVANGT